MKAVPAGTINVGNYSIYAPVFFTNRNGYHAFIDLTGALIFCYTRSTCVYNSGTILTGQYQVVTGGTFSPQQVWPAYQVADVTAVAGTYTIHTTTAHNFSMTANAGLPDRVEVNFWCQTGTATGRRRGIYPVASIVDATHFTVVAGSTTFSNSTCFGQAELLGAAIEDNANGTSYRDIAFYSIGTLTNAFNYGFVFDNDQNAELQGIRYTQAFNCSLTGGGFCGSVIYQRGDQGNASLINVIDSELSMQCSGNGITSISGNGLSVTNTVIQGSGEWGLYLKGGLVGATLTNTYQENGSCPNPLYGVAYPVNPTAGAFIDSRLQSVGNAGFPGFTGSQPYFVNSGALPRQYWVVPHSSLGVGPILPIGNATVLNGSSSVSLVWPNLAIGEQAYTGLQWDIIVTTTTPYSPAMIGNFPGGAAGTQSQGAVVTNLVATCDSKGMCSYTDTQAGTSSYTVTAQSWTPIFWYWPGAMFIDSGFVHEDLLRHQVLSASGSTTQVMQADLCSVMGNPFAPIWIACNGNDPGNQADIGHLISQITAMGNNSNANQKGILNFGPFGNLIGGSATQIITLYDSNGPKTRADFRLRSTSDAGDVGLGIETFSGTGLTMSAPTQVTTYLNVATPDNTSWTERLSTTLDTIKVPLSLPHLAADPAGSAGTALIYQTNANANALYTNVNNQGAQGLNNNLVYSSWQAGASTGARITAAIATASAKGGGTVWVDEVGAQSISTSVTVPANVALVFGPGLVLQPTVAGVQILCAPTGHDISIMGLGAGATLDWSGIADTTANTSSAIILCDFNTGLGDNILIDNFKVIGPRILQNAPTITAGATGTNTATLTGANNFFVGELIAVWGATPGLYNCNACTVTAASPTAFTYTYNNCPSGCGTWVSGGATEGFGGFGIVVQNTHSIAKNLTISRMNVSEIPQYGINVVNYSNVRLNDDTVTHTSTPAIQVECRLANGICEDYVLNNPTVYDADTSDKAGTALINLINTGFASGTLFRRIVVSNGRIANDKACTITGGQCDQLENNFVCNHTATLSATGCGQMLEVNEATDLTITNMDIQSIGKSKSRARAAGGASTRTPHSKAGLLIES